jgi:hypothetical protein
MAFVNHPVEEPDKSLRLCLDVDIGDLGIELVLIPNQQWYYIGCQIEFDCLDDYELSFGILGSMPIQFLFGCANQMN